MVEMNQLFHRDIVVNDVANGHTLIEGGQVGISGFGRTYRKKA